MKWGGGRRVEIFAKCLKAEKAEQKVPVIKRIIRKTRDK